MIFTHFDFHPLTQAFKVLDVDNDGKLQISELQGRKVFDQNRDGVVSEDEAKFFLHMENEMDQNEFLSIGWPLFKPYFMLDPELWKPQSNQEELESEVEGDFNHEVYWVAYNWYYSND